MTAQECLSKLPNPIELDKVWLTQDQIKAIDKNFPLWSSCTAIQLDNLLKSIISAKKQNIENKGQEGRKPYPENTPLNPDSEDEQIPEYEEDTDFINWAMKEINTYYSRIISDESSIKNSINTQSEWESAFEKYQMYHPLQDLADDEISKKFAGWTDRLLAKNWIEKTIRILWFETADELIWVINREPIYLKDLASVLKKQAENINGSSKSNSYEFSINGSSKKYDTKTDAMTAIRDIMEMLVNMQKDRWLW